MMGSLFRPVPDELVAAKEELRDRLITRVERQLVQALAFRKRRRYHPTPGVNLVGIGIGEKTIANRPTSALCVKVLVAKKYPPGRITRSDRIPASIGGVLTDVDGVGYARKFQFPKQVRHRPVPGGVSGSLAFEAVGVRYAGTLGVIVVDRDQPSVLYALSNNHVLANENRAAIGSAVVQPAILDGGKPADRVAALDRFVPLRYNNEPNSMDAAIARFDSGIGVTEVILNLGAPAGSGDPTLNLLVRKAGRTTGVTEGIVRTVQFDVVNVVYEQGSVRMDNVMVIEGVKGSFSRPGDSGSAVVDPQGTVIGLLFAGSDKVTFAIPIQRVLQQLRVDIATAEV
jgi:hypothetical protein